MQRLPRAGGGGARAARGLARRCRRSSRAAASRPSCAARWREPDPPAALARCRIAAVLALAVFWGCGRRPFSPGSSRATTRTASATSRCRPRSGAATPSWSSSGSTTRGTSLPPLPDGAGGLSLVGGRRCASPTAPSRTSTTPRATGASRSSSIPGSVRSPAYADHGAPTKRFASSASPARSWASSAKTQRTCAPSSAVFVRPPASSPQRAGEPEV